MAHARTRDRVHEEGVYIQGRQAFRIQSKIDCTSESKRDSRKATGRFRIMSRNQGMPESTIESRIESTRRSKTEGAKAGESLGSIQARNTRARRGGMASEGP